MKSASHWRFPSVAVALARATLALLAATAGGVARATTQAPTLAKAIDAYIDPFVATNNFSGQLLVVRGNKVIYERQLGWSDRETNRPMSPESELHIASISTQFTAAAIMRLIDQKKLTLETRVSEIVPEVRGAERMTIRTLLEQRSGISDINSRADYTEHSASNVLALIIERRSGLPFARAMRALVYRSLLLGADRDHQRCDGARHRDQLRSLHRNARTRRRAVASYFAASSSDSEKKKRDSRAAFSSESEA